MALQNCQSIVELSIDDLNFVQHHSKVVGKVFGIAF